VAPRLLPQSFGEHWRRNSSSLSTSFGLALERERQLPCLLKIAIVNLETLHRRKLTGQNIEDFRIKLKRANENCDATGSQHSNARTTTSARRWVTVRAMKSLMRMNEPSLNTNRRHDANAVAKLMLPTHRGVAAATVPPFVPLVGSAAPKNASPARTDSQNLSPKARIPRARRVRRRRAPRSIAIWRFQNRNTNVSLPVAYRMVFRFGV